MCNMLFRGAWVVLLGAGLVGCQTKAGTGALIGGAGGAAAGGAIGSMSHSRAGGGALIGAAVGALGGALIGHEMDKSDQREARDRDSASDYTRRHVSAVSEPVTKSDVVSWSRRGLRDEVIIDRIERSGTVFHLTAADENDLRDRGVSDFVIRAMQDTSRR